MPNANLMVRGNFYGGTQGLAMSRESRAGDGVWGMPAPVSDTTAGAYTITTDVIARGGITRNGGAGNRVDTLPTGTVIDAAFSDWAIDEVRMILYSNTGTSNSLTITTAASGTTVSGHSAVLLSTAVWVHITKTAAATYVFKCL